jgi:hypothetical protein
MRQLCFRLLVVVIIVCGVISSVPVHAQTIPSRLIVLNYSTNIKSASITLGTTPLDFQPEFGWMGSYVDLGATDTFVNAQLTGKDGSVNTFGTGFASVTGNDYVLILTNLGTGAESTVINVTTTVFPNMVAFEGKARLIVFNKAVVDRTSVRPVALTVTGSGDMSVSRVIGSGSGGGMMASFNTPDKNEVFAGFILSPGEYSVAGTASNDAKVEVFSIDQLTLEADKVALVIVTGVMPENTVEAAVVNLPQ